MLLEKRRWIAAVVGALLVVVSGATWAANEPLGSTATAAAAGLGKVTQVTAGSAGTIYLFEESHASRAGQIEIAHMLVRLYKAARVRTIGLEGFTGAKLEAPWASQIVTPARRFQVAGRLLGDGELNSAEFMTIAYPDVQVVGIDDPKDYQVEIPTKAAGAPVLYLLLIAEKSMSDEQKRKVNELFDAKKQNEALTLAMNSNAWTKQKYEESRSPSTRNTTGAQLRYIASLEEEAKRRGVQTPGELTQDMQAYKEFFLASDRRSNTMAGRLVDIAKAGQPVAGIIGAAHTESMVSLLAKKGVALAVIRPNALVAFDASKIDPAEIAGYERKVRGLSVDERGLGSLLGSKRKPPPVLTQSWLQHKAGIYQATAAVVDSLLINLDRPPYRFSGLPPGYVVDPGKVTRVGDEVVFALEFQGERERETIWVRAARSASISDPDKRRADIDDRIKRLLAEAGGGGDGKEPPKTPAKTEGKDEPPDPGKRPGKKEGSLREGSVKVAENIYARFSKDEAAVKREAVIAASTS